MRLGEVGWIYRGTSGSLLGCFSKGSGRPSGRRLSEGSGAEPPVTGPDKIVTLLTGPTTLFSSIH